MESYRGLQRDQAVVSRECIRAVRIIGLNRQSSCTAECRQNDDVIPICQFDTSRSFIDADSETKSGR